jgi:hypothetical protein
LATIPELPRANVTSGRLALRDLDADTREKLVRLNRVDLELYAFAGSRFQERKRAIFRHFAERGSDSGWETSPVPVILPNTTARQDVDSTSFGDKAVEICEVQVWGDLSGPRKARSGEMLTIAIAVLPHADVPDLTVTIQIVDDVGEVVFGTNTNALDASRTVLGGERCDVCFVIKADIRHGRYSVTAGLHTGSSRADRCFHWREKTIFFDVVDGEQGPQVGYCKLETKAVWNETAEQPGERRFSVS